MNCRICLQAFDQVVASQVFCKTCIPENRDLVRYRHHGLTRKQYDAMKTRAAGACEICKRFISDVPGEQHEGVMKLYIDHDHASGKRRGLLCPRCNFRLAVLEDETWVDAARSYLKMSP